MPLLKTGVVTGVTPVVLTHKFGTYYGGQPLSFTDPCRLDSSSEVSCETGDPCTFLKSVMSELHCLTQAAAEDGPSLGASLTTAWAHPGLILLDLLIYE